MKHTLNPNWESKRLEKFPYLSPETPVAGMLAEANYQEAIVLIHEYGVDICQGLERGCFLLALKTNKLQGGSIWANINGDPLPSWASEGILLAAKEPVRSWGGGEMLAQRVLSDAYKGDPSGARQPMDEHTRNEISFGALRCRILGTLRRPGAGSTSKFAPDTSAPMFDTTSWVVVKPKGSVLECVVNALSEVSPETHAVFRTKLVEFGRVRWALDERSPETAMAKIRPADFLRKRTAVLGMTGQGKSNAVKLIALSIQIAAMESGQKVGQLLFDPHGEYANETENDRIGAESYSLASACGEDRAVVFSCSPKRSALSTQYPLLVDFYRMPRAAHELLKRGLTKDSADQSGWLNLFLSVNLPSWAWKSNHTFKPEIAIKLICWWGMLNLAGFKHQIPGKPMEKHLQESISSIAIDAAQLTKANTKVPEWFINKCPPATGNRILFTPDLCLEIVKEYYFIHAQGPSALEVTTSSPNTTIALQKLTDFFGDDATLLCQMAMRKRDGRAILGMDVIKPFLSMHWEGSFPKTERLIGQYLHQPSGSSLHIDETIKLVPSPWEVARMLVDSGMLVIIDLSAGDEKLRKLFSETLANNFLEHRKEQNSGNESDDLTEAVIYLEEAHTLVGRNSNADDLWPRIAKEGRKMKIGLVLSTQEPSGVNHHVLANSENFFVGYLNNDKELSEIASIGDLGEYTDTAKRGMEKGYFRVWCREARPYPLPLQLNKFQDMASELVALMKSISIAKT